jgi:hypothetical protein
MVSQKDMSEAVPVSLKTGLPIGRVLAASYALSEHHLQQALLAQSLIRDSLLSTNLAIRALQIVVRESFNLEQALKIVGWQPETFTYENKLGQLLLSAGVVTQLQLDDALRVFYTTGLPLARVLVRKGVMSNLVAYTALSSQQLLRQNKVSRDQALQAVRAAASSNANIEEDYVSGYLRMSPKNNLRLGELLTLAQLITEEALIKAVEKALSKGETLGEVLVGSSLIHADTMERALEAQKMVTKGYLDVARAGDVLRKANYEKISIEEAVAKEAPAVILSKISMPVPQAPSPAMEEARFTATLKDLPTMSSRKLRTPQETRAREMVSRLIEKLEALRVRNNYLIDMVDKDAKNADDAVDLADMKRQIELVADFDDSMDLIDKLLARIETCAYQNGYLRARMDSKTTEAELLEKLRAAQSPATPAPFPVPSGKPKRKK